MAKKVTKRINYNTTYITTTSVIKMFSSKKRYENELYFRSKFKKYFKIPSVLYKNEKLKLIKFEKLNCKSLKDYIVQLSVEDSLNLLRHLTNKLDLVKEFAPKSIVSLKRKYKEELREFLDNTEYLTLIHGDFRLDNIIYDGKDFYLIDFESSKYLFREYDLAYLYFSVLVNNKPLADKFLEEIVTKKYNFELFLHCCKITVYNIINYSKINHEQKKLWYKVLKEIDDDLDSSLS
jgi:thiamine kinase-like enzyme